MRREKALRSATKCLNYASLYETSDLTISLLALVRKEQLYSPAKGKKRETQ